MSEDTMHGIGDDRFYERLRRIYTSVARRSDAPSFDTWFQTEGGRFRRTSRDTVRRYITGQFGRTDRRARPTFGPPDARRCCRVPPPTPPGPSLCATRYARSTSVPVRACVAFESIGPAAMRTHRRRPMWHRRREADRFTATMYSPSSFCPVASVVVADDNEEEEEDDDDDDGVVGSFSPSGDVVYEDATGRPLTCGDFLRHRTTGDIFVVVTCRATADGRGLVVSNGDDGIQALGSSDEETSDPNVRALPLRGIRLVDIVVEGPGL